MKNRDADDGRRADEQRSKTFDQDLFPSKLCRSTLLQFSLLDLIR
jgi:hypothetical protein